MYQLIKKSLLAFVSTLLAFSTFQVAAANLGKAPLEVRVHITAEDKDPIVFILPKRLGRSLCHLYEAFEQWEEKYQIPFFTDDSEERKKDWLVFKSPKGNINLKDWFKAKKTDKVLHLYYQKGAQKVPLTVHAYGKKTIFKSKNGMKPSASIQCDFPWENEEYENNLVDQFEKEIYYREAIEREKEAYDSSSEDSSDEDSDESSAETNQEKAKQVENNDEDDSNTSSSESSTSTNEKKPKKKRKKIESDESSDDSEEDDSNESSAESNENKPKKKGKGLFAKYQQISEDDSNEDSSESSSESNEKKPKKKRKKIESDESSDDSEEDDSNEDSSESISSLDNSEEESWATIEESIHGDIQEESLQSYHSFFYGSDSSDAEDKRAHRNNPIYNRSKLRKNIAKNKQNRLKDEDDKKENSKPLPKIDFVLTHVALRQVVNNLTEPIKQKIEKRELPPPYVARPLTWEEHFRNENHRRNNILENDIPIMKNQKAFTVAFSPMLSFVDMASQTQKDYFLKNTKAATWKAYIEEFPEPYKAYQKAYHTGDWIPMLTPNGRNKTRKEKLQNCMPSMSRQLKIWLGCPQVIVHFAPSAIVRRFRGDRHKPLFGNGKKSKTEQWHIFQSKTPQKEITTQKELLDALFNAKGADYSKVNRKILIYEPSWIHLFKDKERRFPLPKGNLYYNEATKSSVCYAEYGVKVKIHFYKEDKEPIIIYLRKGPGKKLIYLRKRIKKWAKSHYAFPLTQIPIESFKVKNKNGNLVALSRDFKLPKGVNTLALYYPDADAVKNITLKTVNQGAYFKKSTYSIETASQIKIPLPLTSAYEENCIDELIISSQVGKNLSPDTLKAIKNNLQQPPFIPFSFFKSVTKFWNIDFKVARLPHNAQEVPIAFQPLLTIVHGHTLTPKYLPLKNLNAATWQDYFDLLFSHYAGEKLYLLKRESRELETRLMLKNKFNKKPAALDALNEIDEDDKKEKPEAELDKNDDDNIEAFLKESTEELQKQISQRILIGENKEAFAQANSIDDFLHHKMELRILYFPTFTVNFLADPATQKRPAPYICDTDQIRHTDQLKAKIAYPKKEWIQFYSDEKCTHLIEGALDPLKSQRLYAFYGLVCPIFTDQAEKNQIHWFFRKDLQGASQSLFKQLQTWCKKNESPTIRFDHLFMRKKIGQDFSYLHLQSADLDTLKQDQPLTFCFKDPQKYFSKLKNAFITEKNGQVTALYKTKKFPTLTLNFSDLQNFTQQFQLEDQMIFTRDTLQALLKNKLQNEIYNVDQYFYFEDLENFVNQGKVHQIHQKYILKEDLTLKVNYVSNITIYEPFLFEKDAQSHIHFMPGQIQTQAEANDYLAKKYSKSNFYYKPKKTTAIYLPIKQLPKNEPFCKIYYKNQSSFLTLTNKNKPTRIPLGKIAHENLKDTYPLLIDYFTKVSKEKLYWKKQIAEGAQLFLKDESGEYITDLQGRTLSELPQPCPYQVGFPLYVRETENKNEILQIVEEDFLNAKVLKKMIPLQPDCYYTFFYTLEGDKADLLRPFSLTQPFLPTKKLKNGTLSYRIIKNLNPNAPWQKENLTLYNHKLEEVGFRKIQISLTTPLGREKKSLIREKNFTFTRKSLTTLLQDTFKINDSQEDHFHLLNLEHLISNKQILQKDQNYTLEEDIELQVGYGIGITLYDSFAMDQEPKGQPLFLPIKTKNQKEVNEYLREKYKDKYLYYQPQKSRKIFLPLRTMVEPEKNENLCKAYYADQSSFLTLQEASGERTVSIGKLEDDKLKGVTREIMNALKNAENPQGYWAAKKKMGATIYLKDKKGEAITKVQGRTLFELPQPCPYQVGFKITVKKVGNPEDQSVVKIIEQESLNAQALQNLIPLQENYYYAFYYTLQEGDAKNPRLLSLNKPLPTGKALKNATLYYREITTLDQSPDWHKKKNLPTFYDHTLKAITFKKVTITHQKKKYKAIYKEGIQGQALYDMKTENGMNPQQEGLYYKEEEYGENMIVDPESPLPATLPEKLACYEYTHEKIQKDPEQKIATIHIPIGYSFLEKLIYWFSWGYADVSKNKIEKKFFFSFPEFELKNGKIDYEYFLKDLAQKEEIPSPMRTNLSNLEIVIKEGGQEPLHSFSKIALNNIKNSKMQAYIEECNRQVSGQARRNSSLRKLSKMRGGNADVYLLPTKAQKEDTLEGNIAISLSIWSSLLLPTIALLFYKFGIFASLKARFFPETEKKLRPKKKKRKLLPKKLPKEEKEEKKPALPPKKITPKAPQKTKKSLTFFLKYFAPM